MDVPVGVVMKQGNDGDHQDGQPITPQKGGDRASGLLILMINVHRSNSLFAQYCRENWRIFSKDF
jgi:hypothetical protein